MKTSTTLGRIVQNEVAPFLVAFSRTLSHFNSSISQAVETAQNSETTLQTYVTQASNYATNAQTAETNSQTYATNAQQSATEAAASSAASTAVLHSFNQRWLGEHDSDPTTDGNGDPLVDGAEYYSSKTGRIRVYSTQNGFVDISEADTTSVSSAQASAAAAAGSAASANTYMTNAQTSEENAKSYAQSAQQAYENTIGVSIPAASSNVAGSALIVNASGTSYSLLSPAQFLTAIGAAPLDGANFTGVTTAEDITDWKNTTGVVVNQRSMLTYLSSNYVSQTSLASTLTGYVTTSQLTSTASTINTNVTKQLAGVVSTVDASNAFNDQVNQIGISKSTGLPWFYDSTQGKSINVYPTDAVDAKFNACLPLTGGKLSGTTLLSLNGPSVNYTSANTEMGVEITNSSWSGGAVRTTIGVQTNSSGDVGATASRLSVTDSQGNEHTFLFYPSGTVTRPDGDSLLNSSTAKNLYQPIGDYASNTDLTDKTTALQNSINDIYSEMVQTNPLSATQTKVTNIYRDTNNASAGAQGITLQYTDSGGTETVVLADTTLLKQSYQPIGSYLTTQIAQETYLPLSGGTVGPIDVTGDVLSVSVSNPSTNIYTSGSVTAQAQGRGTQGTNGPVAFGLSVTEQVHSSIYGQLSLSGYGSQYNFDFHQTGDVSTIRGTVVQSQVQTNTLLNYSIDVSTLTNSSGSYTFPVTFDTVPTYTTTFTGADGGAKVASMTAQGFDVVASATSGTLHIVITGIS